MLGSKVESSTGNFIQRKGYTLGLRLGGGREYLPHIRKSVLPSSAEWLVPSGPITLVRH